MLNTLSIAADMQGDLMGPLDLDLQNLLINRETGDRVGETIALFNQAEGRLKLGDLAQARRDLDAGLQMARAYGDRQSECVALTGLSAAALWQGDETRALALARQALDIAAGGTLDGTEFPRLIELSCHLALARAGDPRATDWLIRAHSALMAQADTISRSTTDATLRQGFLQNIPHHREIVAAWAKRDVASESPERTAG